MSLVDTRRLQALRMQPLKKLRSLCKTHIHGVGNGYDDLSSLEEALFEREKADLSLITSPFRPLIGLVLLHSIHIVISSSEQLLPSLKR